MRYVWLSDSNDVVAALTKEVNEGVSKHDLFWSAAWPKILEFSKLLLISILIWFIGKRVIKLVLKLTKKGLERAKAEQGVESFLLSLVKIVLFGLLIMLIAGTLGVETSSVIALVGSAGLTIGLALQGSLSNFAGGVLILLLKPFQVGDYIVANGLEGTVTGIDIFYTKLTTADCRLVVLPNGTLSNSSIINVTKEPIRRVDLTASVAYESDLKTVKTLLTSLAENMETTLKGEATPVQVFVDTYGESSINFGLRFFVKSENYWTAKWEANEKIKEVFDQNHIDIPFNQLDVTLKK